MRNTNFLASRSSQSSMTLEVSPYLVLGGLGNLYSTQGRVDDDLFSWSFVWH